MQYTLKTIKSGYFGDSEKWINTQVWDEENKLLTEEIWTKEGQEWELKDIHVGDIGMQSILFKEQDDTSALSALLDDIWQNRRGCA